MTAKRYHLCKVTGLDSQGCQKESFRIRDTEIGDPSGMLLEQVFFTEEDARNATDKLNADSSDSN